MRWLCQISAVIHLCGPVHGGEATEFRVDALFFYTTLQIARYRNGKLKIRYISDATQRHGRILIPWSFTKPTQWWGANWLRGLKKRKGKENQISLISWGVVQQLNLMNLHHPYKSNSCTGVQHHYLLSLATISIAVSQRKKETNHPGYPPLCLI